MEPDACAGSCLILVFLLISLKLLLGGPGFFRGFSEGFWNGFFGWLFGGGHRSPGGRSPFGCLLTTALLAAIGALFCMALKGPTVAK